MTPEEFTKKHEGEYKTNVYCCYCLGGCHMGWACSHVAPSDPRPHCCVCELHQAMLNAGIKLPEPTRWGYLSNQYREEVEELKITCPNCGINLKEGWRNQIAEIYSKREDKIYIF